MNEEYEQLYKNKVKAALPPEYRDGFKNFRATTPEQSALRTAAEEYVKNWKPKTKGVSLLGSVGCGKTYFGCAILAGLIRRGVAEGYNVKVAFANANIFFADVAASFNSNDISEYAITQKLIQCDILLLDDLGTERISEYTQGKLYEIINRIDMAGSPTLLFSSNFGLVQPEPSLTTIYGTNNGARIVSRLEGLTTPLGDFPEIDMRKHP